MNNENSGIKARECGGIVFIRVEGKGTHLNSYLMKQYVLCCLNNNCRQFQVDLSRCTYMDSTFLGMLAGLGNKIKEWSPSLMDLINVTERIKEMLQDLGIGHLFHFTNDGRITGQMSELCGDRITKEQKSREMLEAHENLVSISPTNEAKFRDVLLLLREPVKKIEKMPRLEK